MREDAEDEDGCPGTRRLRLRPVRAADAPEIAAIANERHIAEMTARMPYPYGVADATRFIAGLEGERVFALRRREDGVLLGCAGLKPLVRTGALELGYWLGRPFRGQGYATEAAQALIDHAFADGSVREVEVRCRVVNGASRRVIQKCGFQYAGTSMDVSLVAGRVSSETYRMERGCWQSLHNWFAAR